MVCWIDALPDSSSVGEAVGWYRHEEELLYIRSDLEVDMGDTFLGDSESGRHYSIYLPEMSMTRDDTKPSAFVVPPVLSDLAARSGQITRIPQEAKGCVFGAAALFLAAFFPVLQGLVGL